MPDILDIAPVDVAPGPRTMFGDSVIAGPRTSPTPKTMFGDSAIAGPSPVTPGQQASSLAFQEINANPGLSKEAQYRILSERQAQAGGLIPSAQEYAQTEVSPLGKSLVEQGVQAANAFERGYIAPGRAVLNRVAPETGQRIGSYLNQIAPVSPGVVNTAAGAVGNLASALGLAGGAGSAVAYRTPVLGAVGGATGYDVAREGGAGVGGSLAAGGIGAVLSLLNLGFADKAAKLFPGLTNPLAKYGTAAVASTLEQLVANPAAQAATNYATGRPLDEGLKEAVIAALVGGPLAGAVGTFHAREAGHVPTEPTSTPHETPSNLEPARQLLSEFEPRDRATGQPIEGLDTPEKMAAYVLSRKDYRGPIVDAANAILAAPAEVKAPPTAPLDEVAQGQQALNDIHATKEAAKTTIENLKKGDEVIQRGANSVTAEDVAKSEAAAKAAEFQAGGAKAISEQASREVGVPPEGKPLSPQEQVLLDRAMGRETVLPPETPGQDTVRLLKNIGGLKAGTEHPVIGQDKEGRPVVQLPDGRKAGLGHKVAQLIVAAATGEEGGIRIPAKEDLFGKGSVYEATVKPLFERSAGVAKEIGGWLQRGHSPGGFTEEGAVAKGALRANMAKSDLAQRKAEVAFESAHKGFEKLPRDLQWDFQKRMDDGTKQPTPELNKIARAMHDDTERGRQEIEALGNTAAANWRKEWWNRLWEKDDTQAAATLAKYGQAGRLEGRAGFLKPRSIEVWADGLKQGLVPKFDNPVDMFLATKAERMKYIAHANSVKEIGDMGMAVRMKTPQPGWVKLPATSKALADIMLPNKKGAVGDVYVPEAIAEVLNNVATPSALRGSKLFHVANETNSTLTQVFLGLSGFHLFKTGWENVSIELARANDLMARGEYREAAKAYGHTLIAPVEAPLRGKTIQKQLLGLKPSSPQGAVILDAIIDKGGARATEDPAYTTQWRKRLSRAWQQGGVNGLIKSGLNLPGAVNEAAMQRIIFNVSQSSKLFHEFQQTADVLRQNPNADIHELRTKVGKVIDHIDNNLGLMVRDNLFWNKTARDVATLATLSVGWNYGSLRGLVGGLKETAQAGASVLSGKGIKHLDTRQASYLLTQGALAAFAGATITYLATGHGPKTLTDYIFPDTGKKDKFGHAVRLRLPSYVGDWYDFVTSPAETAKNKASPLLHAAASLGTNKDYFGTTIRNTDGSLYEQAKDVAIYLSTLLVPASVRQLRDTIAGKGSAASANMEAIPFVGVRIAAKKHSYSSAEARARELMAEELPVGGRTREAAEHSRMVMDLADDLRDKKEGAKDEIRKLAQAGTLTPADITRVKDMITSPSGMVGLLKRSSFDAKQLVSVWDRMTAEEKRTTGAIVLMKLRDSESINATQRGEYIKQVKAEWMKAKAGNE